MQLERNFSYLIYYWYEPVAIDYRKQDTGATEFMFSTCYIGKFSRYILMKNNSTSKSAS